MIGGYLLKQIPEGAIMKAALKMAKLRKCGSVSLKSAYKCALTATEVALFTHEKVDE